MVPFIVLMFGFFTEIKKKVIIGSQLFYITYFTKSFRVLNKEDSQLMARLARVKKSSSKSNDKQS